MSSDGDQDADAELALLPERLRRARETRVGFPVPKTSIATHGCLSSRSSSTTSATEQVDRFIAALVAHLPADLSASRLSRSGADTSRLRWMVPAVA